jgi:hypothetical protein
MVVAAPAMNGCERSEAQSRTDGPSGKTLRAGLQRTRYTLRNTRTRRMPEIASPRLRAMAPMKTMRSWRSPRLLRIALRAAPPPTQKRKEPWGTPPMPPVSFCTFFGDAQDMPFDWLRTCPAGARDGTG